MARRKDSPQKAAMREMMEAALGDRFKFCVNVKN